MHTWKGARVSTALKHSTNTCKYRNLHLHSSAFCAGAYEDSPVVVGVAFTHLAIREEVREGG